MGFCCGGWGWSGWGGMGMIGPTIIGLVLLAGVVAVLGLGAIWVIGRASRGPEATDTRRRGEDPVDIARQRLAAGELTKEEFDKLRDQLRR